MRMTAESLELINWQGVTERYELSKLMDVEGKNGSGKTRFKNAISYIISGRDSNGKAQFDIKDYKNPQYNRDPHTVILNLKMQDGKGLTLQKDYLEQWGTDKGSEVEFLKGHKTVYWVNGNSKSKGEYEEFMSALIPVDLLQILSDPLFFPNMDWTKQRAILEQIAGDITNENVLDSLKMQNQNVKSLVDLFADGHTVEARKTRIKLELKIAQEEKSKVKPAIAENNNTIKSFGVIDSAAINEKIEDLKKQVETIDQTLSDFSKSEEAQSNEIRAKRQEMSRLKDEISDLERKHESDYKKDLLDYSAGKEDLENRVANIEFQLRSKNSLLESLLNGEKSFVSQLQEIGKEFENVNAKDFPEWDKNNFGCDKCGTKFEQNKVDEKIASLESDFIERKKEALSSIKSRGESKKEAIKKERETIEIVKNAIQNLETELTAAKENLSKKLEEIASKTEVKSAAKRIEEDVEISARLEKIRAIEKQISEVKPLEQNQDLKNQRTELNNSIDAEKSKLHNVSTIKSLEERNEKLAEKEKELASQIAKLQKEEILIGQFIITRMDLVKKSVENLFEYVTFKMFDTNITTGENTPFCELWIDGKPFSACNNALQVNAGLDVINALSKHYGVYIPILIDNAEGVQSFVEVDTQMITLTVGRGEVDAFGTPTGKLLITHK